MQITLRNPAFRTTLTWITRKPVLRWPLSGLQMAALAILGVVLLPVAYLVMRALGAGTEGVAYLLDARTLGVVGNSLALTAAVVLSSALIGVPFAWLTARTNLPLRRLWLISGLLTLVIPSYIGALTYIAAFGPQGMLAKALGAQFPPIYGFFGAWLAITLFTYPVVALPARAALLNMDPALEDAARSLGLSRWQVFWRVTLPQLRPALAAGLLLSALYTLSDFGAVSLMRYDAFTRVIHMQYTSSFDRSRAAVLAVVLVMLTVALLILSRCAASRNYRVGTCTQRPMRPVELGRWRIPALIFCALLVGIGLVTPLAVLASWVGQGAHAPAPEIMQPMLNTVGVSGLTALVVGLAAMPLALLAARSSSRANQQLYRLSHLGYGLPGLVIALALVFFAANFLPGLYQTLPILIVGYAVRFLPLSVGATRSALSQINPRIEEAARSLGLSSWQITVRITAPLARAGILGGMALVFLNAMKELPTTLLLSPTGFETFATQIWTAKTEINFAQIGIPALLLVAASALSLSLILKQER